MNDFLILIVSSLWFILPAYLANAAPVLSSIDVVKKYNFAIDMGRTWKGNPLFGSHKTFFGIIFGLLVGSFIGLLQISTQNLFNLELFPMTLFLAFVLSAGALFGDLVASFIKRRLNIRSGQKAPFLLDQLNLVFGAFLFSAFLVGFLWKYFLILVIITPVFHKIFNVIAYKINLKKQPW